MQRDPEFDAFEYENSECIYNQNLDNESWNRNIGQNRSHAVMAQRAVSTDNLDDFPTPPWATRALLHHVIPEFVQPSQNVLEPACNRGYMSRTLKEFYKNVISSDIYNYGYGDIKDFLQQPYKKDQFDWVITNPPFKNAEEFIHEGLRIARVGVAILARTVFLESIGRYDRLFSRTPPALIAQFSERVPMFRGRLNPNGSTATGYAWFVWKKNNKEKPLLSWIPPCRKLLERDDDYNCHPLISNTSPSKQVCMFG